LARPHGPPRAALAAGPAGAHPHRIGRTRGGAGRAPRARAAAQSAGTRPGHRAARRTRLPRPDARGAGARAAARPAARAHPDRARPLRRPAPALRARGRRGRALRGHGRAQARAARIRRARASGSRPGVPARTLRRAAARDPGGGDGAPPAVRVLVVDDEPSVVDVFRDFLGAQGYVLSAASSAEEALKVIPDLRPDIILTDINLPGLSGLEVMRFAKRVDPEVAVIV